ncbi:MAG: penicillin-binding protein 2 [Candidatus Eisenbacteria bacterium]|uniref:Penicillin-binding protein 2 n=1 Tax=Eiseniibacteriota bacterium TaxID=2212470 RepID=A0A538UAL2_UNCEI|nr:MAG: penicillin-binding protein 2 [Candidatus Eisenbacteria bacterium]
MQTYNQERRSKEHRYVALLAIAVAGFAVIAVGLLKLQIQDHDYYLRLAQENRIRLEVMRAPRGAIYDRNGVLLADNYPSFEIVFRPLPAESTQRALLVVDPRWVREVSHLVQEDSSKITELVRQANRSGETSVLRHNAPFPVLAAVEESRGELPGLEVMIEPLRRYPHGTVASHLLGYAGEISDDELDERSEQGYRSGDLIGRTGVERSFEEYLRGRDGAEFVVVNAMGRRVSTISEGPPQRPDPGHDLVLTLDLRVQQAMEDAMAKVSRGAAVAIDPRDGGILGMVSRPAFDPNEFSRGLSFARWSELSNGGANPLLNRAIQGAYPPGSTFKVVIMLAALRSGIASAASRFQACTGKFFFGGRGFGCWKHTGHGSLDFPAALQNSCDVYFYQVGMKLGLTRLEEAAVSFGFGDRTGIDLPQERRGLVPSEAMYDKRWGVGRWPKGLLLNLAIGQGEILVTPLQLATMLAEVAMDGEPIDPHVVREVRGVGPVRRVHAHRPRVEADAATWDAVHTGLERVVESGTGTAARVRGLRVAGKTGTAQNPHGKDQSRWRS